MELWGYASDSITKDEADKLAEFLEEKGSPFKRDGARPFLYKLRTITQQTADGAQERGLADNQQEVTDIIDSLFPSGTGLYRRSLHLDRKTVMLSFFFPKVALKTFEAKLEELRSKILWKVEINPETHQQALVDVALKLIPKEWDIKKRPAIHAQHNTVSVQTNSLGELDAIRAIIQKFYDETGFRLVFDNAKGLSTAPEVAEAEPKGPAMEINASYKYIRDTFEGGPHKPLKVGLKNSPSKHIEVAFLSPELGVRYKETLSKISQEIGWEIRIRQHADQHKIKEIAKELLAKYKIAKEPGFQSGSGAVEVRVGLIPEYEDRKELEKQFEELTGCRLVIV
jgi:hypothetical protein